MDDNNGHDNVLEGEELERYVGSLNATAIIENISEMRTTYGNRITHLENEVITLKSLITKMQQVYGQLLQVEMGSGRTETDR